MGRKKKLVEVTNREEIKKEINHTEITNDFDILSYRCDEVDIRKENAIIREIILNLKKVIREKNLVSLAAPQLSYTKRIFCINFSGDIRTFINPIISNVKGFELNKETCSSIPDKTYIRPRHNDITVIYQTPLGKTESKKIVGVAAKVFQHAIDHLDGLLISDVGLEIDEQFDKASEKEQAEIIKMYMDSLDIKQKEINTEIQSNEELKKMSDAIEFISKVQSGEVKIEPIINKEKKQDG